MAQDPYHIVCIEPRFPGRLGAIADWLVRRRGYRCWFYCNAFDPQAYWPPSAGTGLDVIKFEVGGVASEPQVYWTRNLERGLCYAYGCWEVLDGRRPRPVDVVLGRSAGLGSTLFTPITYPAAGIVNLMDGYLKPREHDITSELDNDTSVNYYAWRAAAGTMDLLDMDNGSIPWAATRYQRDSYPEAYRDDFEVFFDGVDVRLFRRARPERPRMIARRMIPQDAKVVTFVARSLDRVRGFDRFLRLARRLEIEFPEAIFVVAGAPIVVRGLDLPFYGTNYLEHLIKESPLVDPSRYWFLGYVDRPTIAELLGVSDLHVAPGRTFFPARSIAESMSAECLILASNDEPTRELIENDVTGLLVDSTDPDALFERARAALRDLAAFRPLGQAAGKAARERFDQDVVLPKLALIFDRLVEGDYARR